MLIVIVPFVCAFYTAQKKRCLLLGEPTMIFKANTALLRTVDPADTGLDIKPAD